MPPPSNFSYPSSVSAMTVERFQEFMAQETNLDGDYISAERRVLKTPRGLLSTDQHFLVTSQKPGNWKTVQNLLSENNSSGSLTHPNKLSANEIYGAEFDDLALWVGMFSNDDTVDKTGIMKPSSDSLVRVGWLLRKEMFVWMVPAVHRYNSVQGVEVGKILFAPKYQSDLVMLKSTPDSAKSLNTLHSSQRLKLSAASTFCQDLRQRNELRLIKLETGQVLHELGKIDLESTKIRVVSDRVSNAEQMMKDLENKMQFYEFSAIEQLVSFQADWDYHDSEGAETLYKRLSIDFRWVVIRELGQAIRDNKFHVDWRWIVDLFETWNILYGSNHNNFESKLDAECEWSSARKQFRQKLFEELESSFSRKRQRSPNFSLYDKLVPSQLANEKIARVLYSTIRGIWNALKEDDRARGMVNGSSGTGTDLQIGLEKFLRHKDGSKFNESLKMILRAYSAAIFSRAPSSARDYTLSVMKHLNGVMTLSGEEHDQKSS